MYVKIADRISEGSDSMEVLGTEGDTSRACFGDRGGDASALRLLLMASRRKSQNATLTSLTVMRSD